MIDIKKKYRYADGNGKARILCLDRETEGANYPVVSMDIYGGLYCHQENGVCSYDRKFDLIEVKEKREFWVNVLSNCRNELYFLSYPNKPKAVNHMGDITIAQVKVEWEEGQFDE